MPQVKNIFGDLYTFALRVHSNGKTPMCKTLENRVLGHISPETIYLAMECEHRSLLGESTIKLLFHKLHTAMFLKIRAGTVLVNHFVQSDYRDN